MDLSPPYVRHISERDLNHVIANYDAEINWVDHHIGKLIEKLKEKGVWDNTIIMVVADHDVEPPWDQFHRLPYRTIVSKQDQPDLLLHWSRHRLVGRVGDFRVFRVSGPQAVSGD